MVCYLVMGWTIIGAIKQVYNNIDLSDDDYEFVHNEVKINRLREKEIEIQIELIDNLRF